MAGITRYASIHMPMDETLSRVVIGFISGQRCWCSGHRATKVDQFDTELVREWFNAFTINAGDFARRDPTGENSHHYAAKIAARGLPS
jgi:imidazoleglycerol-phosphate dehydratase